jgi:hypothetical protein
MKTKDSDYQKTKEDDLQHMGMGLQGYKGRIHYCFGKPIIDDLKLLKKISVKNDQLAVLAEIIDKYIHLNYHLWQTNYIAWDFLHSSNAYSEQYTENEKAEFIKYIDVQVTKCNMNNADDKEFIKNFMLQMYANPVVNKRKA